MEARQNQIEVIKDCEIRKKLVPRGWSYVYLTRDLKNGKYYIGSHKNTDPHYVGGGIIITRIKKKRYQDLLHVPFFWHPEEKVVRRMEEYFLNYFNAAENPNFYNLKNTAIGGNTLLGKTEEERKEIIRKSIVKRTKTLVNKSEEWKNRRRDKQRATLLFNCKKNSEAIRFSLSQLTPEQKQQKIIKNLKSRFEKGKVYVIEAVDRQNISHGIYLGAESIARSFPISSVGVLQNTRRKNPIKDPNHPLLGWKFLLRNDMSWEEVVEHAKSVLNNI